ncbi:MAG: hypothetical protein R3B09_20465 [Nannocystaceae bacterium]
MVYEHRLLDGDEVVVAGLVSAECIHVDPYRGGELALREAPAMPVVVATVP